MTDTTMGQRIAERRKLLGLSQEALGDKMGVSRQAISKWEADGAVPEIDKLIAMSRLFSVSVGWLLGVEDSQPDGQEEAFSEKQLKMIEELLKKYQQPPEQKKPTQWQPLLRIAAIIAVLIVAVTALNRVNDIPNYANQLSNLSNNYSNMQSQLSSLAAQLEQLRQGELLLARYEVTARANDDLSAGIVHFEAVPNDIQAGEQAWLQVYHNGENVASQMCQLNGSVYTAELQLPPENDYAYHFMVVHSGGDSSTQILEDVDHYAVRIAKGLLPDVYGDVSSSQLREGALEMDFCTVNLNPPALMENTDGLVWEKAELLLTLNGEEKLRIDLMTQPSVWDEPVVQGAGIYTGFWMENMKFEMKNGDIMEATVHAKLSNGMEVEEVMGHWCCEGTSIVQEEMTDEK